VTGPMTSSILIGSPVETPRTVHKPASPSEWIWVPYVWLFIASTRGLSNWFQSGSHTAIDPDVSGSPLDRAVLTLLILLAFIVLHSRAERTRQILSRNKWLIVLFFYMLASVLWSNFPAISFRRCMRSMGTFVVVLVVLTEGEPLEAMGTLLRRLYLVCIPLSIVAIKYFRNIGVYYNWSGVEEQWMGLSTDKNSLGQVAMCSGLFFTWRILQNWNRQRLSVDLLLLVLTLWLLRGSKTSHSSTAIIGFIIGVVVLFGLQYIKKRAADAKRIILGATMALILLAPLGYLAFEAFDTTPVGMVLEATGRDMTLTDRTLLWADVLNNAAKSPVAGVGFGAFWVGEIGYAMYPLPNWSRKTPGWRPGEAHNGYVDIYVDLGLIGLALVLIIISVGFAGALDDLQNEFEMGRIRLVLLLSIIMNNITESTLLKGPYSLWFLFLLVAVNIPKRDSEDTFEKGGADSNRSTNHYGLANEW